MLPADCDCFKCKHYHREEVKKPFNCDTYPEGIPPKILYGEPNDACVYVELESVKKKAGIDFFNRLE